jgi:hypothetical protein|tara:strand:+ start:51 stop:359 length:309 start_codon:yes stop_codon:yes gene_type:complete
MESYKNVCLYHLLEACCFGIHCKFSHIEIPYNVKSYIINNIDSSKFKGIFRAKKYYKKRQLIVNYWLYYGYDKEEIQNYLDNNGRGHDTLNSKTVNPKYLKN